MWIHLFLGLKGGPSGLVEIRRRHRSGHPRRVEGSARGREVQWIGGVLELRAASVELALTINDKLMTESRTEGEQLIHTEVGGLLQAERLAGKLSWVLQGSSRAPPRR